MPGNCTSCNGGSFHLDAESERLYCNVCGKLQEYNNYVDFCGGISTGPLGTYVRVGTTGHGSSDFSYRETKIHDAKRLVDDVSHRLSLSDSRADQIKSMIHDITAGEFGQGNWLNVLVGACAYVVMRRDRKALPIAEVSSVIGVDQYELGRMIIRVVEFLNLNKPDFPEFDIVGLYERTLKNLTVSVLDSVEESVLDRMRTQGVFLVQCAIKWFLTTGRRPLPMVVAVLVLVAELNGFRKVGIEECAREVSAVASTCRLRYRELLEALVKAAQQVLPWGKDVNVKNVTRHAPSVIRYMEKRSMAQPSQGLELACVRSHIDVEDVVRECLRKDGDDCNADNNSAPLHDSRHMGNLKLSHESLSMVYSKFLEEMESFKSSGGFGAFSGREYRQGFDPNEWWDGKSELSKKLLLKNILEKDVGLEAVPPSYIKGLKARQRRRERIKAAKMRIQKVMNPSKAQSDAGISEDAQTGKKRKRRCGIDWEDLIIETLLLHQVKEEEIETGWYNNLLSLHVFNSGVV